MRLVNLNGKRYECDDYRTIAEQFIPEILRIVSAKQDKEIQERFLSRLLAIQKSINKTGQFLPTLAETTFFDVMLDAIENNISAQELFKFINSCVRETTASLGGSLRKKIKIKVYNMVINESGSGFYTGVAEFACLSKIFRIGKLKIKDIERKLPNGKSVDMVVGCHGGDCFIDVVSMFFDEGKCHSNEDMYKFLYGKIVDKYEAKFQGLENAFLRDCGIMPVIWGKLGRFKQYEEALGEIPSRYKNQLIPPYGLVYVRQKGYYFRPIKDFIKKIK